MERKGLLLEKGMSGGYFYGTPKPEPYHPNMQPKGGPSGSGNLGRLPPGWEVSYDQYGQKYFINHNDGTTTWMDPRLVALQHHSAKNTNHGELPYGWEAVKSATLGIYYIDHINQRTSLQHPNLQQQQQHTLLPGQEDLAMLSGYGSPMATSQGNIISVTLNKTNKGFGFTLYGGDKSGQPILIKSVKAGTPADVQAGLVGGELLVRVNGEAISHLSHSQVVQIFKAVPNGAPVHLELRRNHQGNGNHVNSHVMYPTPPTYYPGYPQPTKNNQMYNYGQNNNNSVRSNGSSNSSPDLIPIYIDKGTNGFGFTIHQGPNGQRVKSIMDVARCCYLMEGDVIVQINGEETLNRSHSEIVTLLKSIPPHSRTLFLINRTLDNNNPSSGDHLKRSDKRNKSFRGRATYVQQPVAQHPGPPSSHHPPTYHQIDVPINQDPIHHTMVYPVSHNPLSQPRQPLTQQIDSNRISDHGSNFSGSERHRHLSGSDRLYRVGGATSGSERLTNPYTSGSERFSERIMPPEHAQFEDHQVVLQRDNNGFGFRIIGGEEQGTPVIIGHVSPEGPADGSLRIYDELRSINGQNVLGAYHITVIDLIEQAASYQGKVTLLVRRYANPETIFNLAGLQLQEPENVRYRLVNIRNVTITKSIDECLGFVIHSSVRDDTFRIGQVVENSPAGRCGDLYEGDIVLAVEGTAITGLSHKTVVEMIKKCKTIVQLGVASQQIVTDEDDYDWEEETELVPITLERDEKGFGFSIRGGKAFQENTLFVLRIGKDGAADRDGRLRRGDEIVEINGESMKEVDHQHAVDKIKSGGGVLNIVVRRRKLEIPPIIQDGLEEKPQSLQYPVRTEISSDVNEANRKGGDTPEKADGPPPPPLPTTDKEARHEYDRYEVPVAPSSPPPQD